jgi:hypothetical protein
VLEAYLFAAGEGATPQEALQAALRRAGGKPAWIEELVWLGAPAPELETPKPALSLPEGPGLDHFSLNASLRQLCAGERQMLVAGQTRAERSIALLLGAPAVVGRRNLLPQARLHPAPALPTNLIALETAVQAFVLSFAERPDPPEPSVEDKPLIISPAMPPPAPVPPLKIPEVTLLVQVGADLPILPVARRLEPVAGAFFGLANLVRALETQRQDWGGLFSGLESTTLLTLVERI